jgi:hypothetical protein
MINLLPPETKQGYRYGISNVRLIRWVLAGAVSIVGLGIIGTYGWLSLHQNISNYSGQVAAVQSKLKQDKQQQTYAQVQDISNSFRLAVQVLSKEVLFSKLLRQMGAAMPSGAYLSDLSISKVQGGLDITAQTINQQTATQVQVNLADPTNGIFAKADIVNIVCTAKNAVDPTHPCTVNLRALFAQNNPFLFINSKGAAK